MFSATRNPTKIQHTNRFRREFWDSDVSESIKIQRRENLRDPASGRCEAARKAIKPYEVKVEDGKTMIALD